MIKILLVDSDLGFTFWLGQLLDQAGYEAFPAKSVADAIQLLDQLKFDIDLLVINPAMEGATSFAAVLRQSRPFIKIVAVHEPELMDRWAEVDASHPKTHSSDEVTRSEWLSFFGMFCRPAAIKQKALSS